MQTSKKYCSTPPLFLRSSLLRVLEKKQRAGARPFARWIEHQNSLVGYSGQNGAARSPVRHSEQRVKYHVLHITKEKPSIVEIAKAKRVLPLREQALESVMHALRAGQFLPGERLTEEGVAAVLGVSRTPVREALVLLAQRGVLTRRDGGGFTVTSHCAKRLKGIFELRRLLEPYAARRVAELATPAQLKQLGDALQNLRKMIDEGDANQAMQANSDLRHLLFSFTDNEALAGAIANLNEHVHFIGMLTMKDPVVRKALLAKHRRIFTALSSRDPAAAEQAMLEYLESGFRFVSKALPTQAGLMAGGDDAPETKRRRV